MKNKKDDEKHNDSCQKKKKSYIKPIINSEELIGFGALCNGAASGGRKSSAGAPDFCRAGRLLS
jgi:hypothetical protein